MSSNRTYLMSAVESAAPSRSAPQDSPPKLSVLAIDPGRAKCGVAVVANDGEIAFRGVIPTEALVTTVQQLAEARCPIAILVGGGTGAKPLLRALQAAGLSAPIQTVDETRTSELARARYVAENPAQGWQRLLPRSLRTPPGPYDDYVAVILAERYWQAQEGGRD
jgi:RNase H-fold protein (predicted Holliday junction resolvase)